MGLGIGALPPVIVGSAIIVLIALIVGLLRASSRLFNIDSRMGTHVLGGRVSAHDARRVSQEEARRRPCEQARGII